MKDGSGIVAVIETVKGTIRLTLFDQRVPVTTGNFVNLTRRGYYDGLTFHRVIPNFGAPVATVGAVLDMSFTTNFETSWCTTNQGHFRWRMQARERTEASFS